MTETRVAKKMYGPTPYIFTNSLFTEKVGALLLYKFRKKKYHFDIDFHHIVFSFAAGSTYSWIMCYLGNRIQ